MTIDTKKQQYVIAAVIIVAIVLLGVFISTRSSPEERQYDQFVQDVEATQESQPVLSLSDATSVDENTTVEVFAVETAEDEAMIRNIQPAEPFTADLNG